MSGFHGAFATGVASQQGTLTLPDTWFRPPFWDLLMLQLLRPNSSNLPCLYSTFHLEYPLVLSRFYLQHAISCFAKAYRNNIASIILQAAVCGIHLSKSFTWYHILLLELISFQQLQPQNRRQRQIVNYVMRIQRLHKLQYHRRVSVLFSMFYALFNKSQRNFNETVCERTRFAKI